MAFIGLLLVFLVCASFPSAPSDLCDGLHGQHNFLSKNLGHNGLPVLKLSVPLEHPNEFWVYQLWIVEVATNFTKKQSMLYVKAKTFQHTMLKKCSM